MSACASITVFALMASVSVNRSITAAIANILTKMLKERVQCRTHLLS